jgi:hypothetical protein
MTFLKSAVAVGLTFALIPGFGVAENAGLPLLGRWATDLEHSQIPPEARPQSVTITYSDAGKGRWNTDVVIVGSDGGKINATTTYPHDGTLAPGKGYPNVDSVAVRVPRPTVMVAAFYKAGAPRSTRTYIVSPDGKTMLENIVWLGENGKPEIATNQFRRVK